MKSPQFTQDKMSRFEQLCREQGVPLTVQRRVILQSLALREDHPTADEIFEDVETKLPGLSRTTVYRVLETLVSMGVIHKAIHLGSAARYDPNTEQHHHLTCVSCHKVVDLEEHSLPSLRLSQTRAGNFEILDYSVHFRGLCRDCARKKTVKKA